MNTGHFHSEDLKALVRSLWARDISTREIAAMTRMSRNSVSGMVRRLGLPKRTQGGVKRGWTARKFNLANPKTKAPEPIGPIGDFPPIGTCRFIAGDPGAKFQCCGHPGEPFCDHHAKRVYLPKKDKA